MKSGTKKRERKDEGKIRVKKVKQMPIGKK
jgi:hypothetical protein